MVLENPKENWKTMSEHLKKDKSFVLKVIEKASVLPSKSDFERGFEQWLRFDKDVVLAFCGRHDFEQIYQDRHLFVPGCLTDDKDVMMAYCSKIPRQLQECSERLCDDEEVVLTALQCNGLELQYASIRLQQDEAMLRTACSLDGRALEFCPPGETRDKLLADREFLLMVLRNNGARMLRLLSCPKLRTDEELLLTAIEHNMHLRYCPKELKENPEFVVKAVTKKAQVFQELPLAIAKNSEIAEATVKSPTSTPAIIDKAVQLCPEILNLHSVALAAVERGSMEFVKKFITEDNTAYLSDKRIMMRVLERDSSLYTSCRGGLQQDVDIVMAALKDASAVSILRSVGNMWLIRFPQAAVRAITVALARNLTTIRPHIPDELWSSNRDLALAWLRKGGRVLPHFERTVRTDREMALTIAEFVPQEFFRVGVPLRSDVKFMEQAVEKSGRVHRFCAGTLPQDKELAVRAVANFAHALQRDGPISKEQLQEFVQEQMALRENFVRDFLRGIAVSQQSHMAPGLRSALPMLDRGVETGTALKQLIADFLGIPTGMKLTMYRKCLGHLQNPPPMEPEDELAGMDRMTRRAFMVRRMRDGRDRDMDRMAMVMNLRVGGGRGGPMAAQLGADAIVGGPMAAQLGVDVVVGGRPAMAFHRLNNNNNNGGGAAGVAGAAAVAAAPDNNNGGIAERANNDRVAFGAPNNRPIRHPFAEAARAADLNPFADAANAMAADRPNVDAMIDAPPLRRPPAARRDRARMLGMMGGPARAMGRMAMDDMEDDIGMMMFEREAMMHDMFDDWDDDDDL